MPGCRNVPGTFGAYSGHMSRQLKWLYSGTAVTLIAFVLGVFAVPLAMGQSPGSGTQPVVQALWKLKPPVTPSMSRTSPAKWRPGQRRLYIVLKLTSSSRTQSRLEQ